MINALLAIAVALILGLLVTRLMKLIGLPNVTGYLLVGLIIGPYALGIISPEVNESLSVISTVALGFIGFSIGVEFKLSHIKEIGKSAITITMFQALMATLCVDVTLIAFGSLLDMPIHEALILGAIATATAPAATLMVVRQYKAKGIVTGTLLPVVALDDAVGLIVFSISNSVALSMASGTSISVMTILVWPLVEIIASLVIGGLIGALLSIIPRFFKSRDNRLIASIVAVFLSLGVCELFGYLEDSHGLPFGLSDLLVCMMAGAVFVNVRSEARQMMEGVDHWTPVVLMLFFILSGAELNFRMFSSIIMVLCILVYIVSRCVGKYFGTMLGATITKSDKNVRKYLGITLFPQAGVAIGMATMCKNEFVKVGMPDIGAKIVTITMCSVLIYELVGPVLTKWALTKAGEIDPANLGKRKKNATATVAPAVVANSSSAENLSTSAENVSENAPSSDAANPTDKN
ncbi:MAG: cation:proton antiporter [Candidatus Fimimonas sp.]